MSLVASHRPEVLFVLGVQQRSGTNFLFDLLSLHPRCAPIRRIWEDKLLTQVQLLDEYVERVSTQWAPHWDPDGLAADELRDHLAQACLDWLAALPKPSRLAGARFVVTKSPTVKNLDRLAIFRRSRTLVIVRDGRAVVESWLRSFGGDFETTATRWARAARVVLDGLEADAPFLLVRYEDLVTDLEPQLRRILGYLDLDPGELDFGQAADLPVRGSSSFGTKDGEPNWLPTEKDDGFRPLERFAHWSPEQHAVFNELAGGELARLGYKPEG